MMFNDPKLGDFFELKGSRQYQVYGEDGWITVDDYKELQEELDRINSLLKGGPYDKKNVLGKFISPRTSGSSSRNDRENSKSSRFC